jgi:hypothetical protein
VIHISNDAGNPCLPVPDGRRERLSARALRFVDATKGATIRCASDVTALESSLAQSVFYPLFAPIQSLMNVRTEHSKRAVAELRSMYSPISIDTYFGPLGSRRMGKAGNGVNGDLPFAPFSPLPPW